MTFELPSDLVDVLRAAERVVVLTGAGVSAESGVPTFREAQTGLWKQYDPRELATPQAFARNPRLVWEWYQWRRALIEKARPNPAHYALVDLEQHVSQFLLVTQNIDGFHWAAGSRDMVELHGNIARTRCFDEGTLIDSWTDDEVPPRCYHCGAYLRPDVVWFGEGIPGHALDQALTAAGACDVFLSVGTSAMVSPAASFPIIAKRNGARIVEINPDQTALAVIADWSVRGKAGEVLPELVRQLGYPGIALEGAGFPVMLSPAAFMTTTLQEHSRGMDVAAVLHAAIRAVEPYTAVRRHLQCSGNVLRAGPEEYDLGAIGSVLVLAIGKAAAPMARAALDVVGPRVTGGLVVPKGAGPEPATQLGPLDVLPAAHPVPDARSLLAGQRAIELARSATGADLLLVLLSGGGSALVTSPAGDITLDDMRVLTGLLLRSGATINEINALRRRCDRVKGGGLLRAAGPARVAVLVLSDVVGDDLASIASGPFVVEAAEQLDARAVVERYELQAALPESIRRHLADAPVQPLAAPAGVAPHTIIANVDVAAHGTLAEARARGFHAQVLTTRLSGEASERGRELAARLVAIPAAERPCCLVAGGETTVTLQGDGLGGRNQELALAAVEPLAGHDDLLLVALATDGGDGPTDAAGAVVGGATLARGRALGLEPHDVLRRNDAYHYFEPLGDLLKPGPTQTNVNDLVLLFAF